MKHSALLVALLAWAVILSSPAQARTSLVEVPSPALGNLEETDRRQLERARSELDGLLASETPDPDALAQAFGEVGSLYLLYDLVEPARAALENAATLAPDELSWHYYLGVLAQREGQIETARSHLERALEIRPEELPALIRLGRVELAAGRWDRAEELFRDALERAPSSAAALVGLGRIAYERDRPREAVDRFHRALELQPEATSIHHRLGLAYRALGELEKAREHLAANRHDPVRFSDPLVDRLSLFLQAATVHLKRGNSALEAGDLDRALREYREAARRDPEDPLIQYNLGFALARAGQREEAAASFRRALELDPGYRDARYNLAVALAEEERWEEAARQYRRVVEIDPLDHSARFEWAVALFRADRLAEAVRELSTVLAEAPTGRVELRRGARAQLATVARELGRRSRFAEAADAYDSLVTTDPGDVEARFGRSMALILAGRYADARDSLVEGMDAVEDAVPLLHLLARLLATAPDPEIRDGARATELAMRAFRAEPSLAHASTVAMALAEAGRFDQAVEWQRRVAGRARAIGRGDLVARARRHLAMYERGERVREPWRSEE